LTLFSEEWNDYFRRFDDSIIPIIQYFHLKKSGSILNKIFGGLFVIFAYLTTFLTQIEYGPSICVFFVTTGFDHLSRWFIISGIITAIIAQFPKRFLFRKRPYMEKRALQIGKDDTSSFPSRAVVCGVVYSFAAVYAYNAHHGTVDSGSIYQFIVFPILGGLAASFSRIHLGVHYPSDCVCGLILGYMIALSSLAISHLPNIFGCPSCGDGSCYVGLGLKAMTAKTFELQNIHLAFLVIIITGLLQIFSNWPPLKFWDKSAPIFGTFCACISVEIMLACPKYGAKALGNDFEISKDGYIWAVILTQVNLMLSVVTTKVYRKMKKLTWEMAIMWNVAIFLFFTITFMISIIKVRLNIMFPSS